MVDFATKLVSLFLFAVFCIFFIIYDSSSDVFRSVCSELKESSLLVDDMISSSIIVLARLKPSARLALPRVLVIYIRLPTPLAGVKLTTPADAYFILGDTISL